MSDEQQHLSGPMVILCIVNGMIGGLILILPVMALESGWLLTLVVLLVTGFASYYSCYLCIVHTGKDPDLDVAILKVFNGNKIMKLLYELCILISLVLLAMLYYELIVLQWIGLAPPHEFTSTNAFINFAALFVMVLVIKFKDFGASLMAYGVVSIIAYLLFITWVVGSEDASHDHSSLKPIQGNGVDLAAALGQAFAIQFFFIPILKKSKKQHKHKLYLVFVFILGGMAYAYIAFMGSYGIVHRTFVAQGQSKTIEGYFETGTWEVAAIQIIYLVHLYSVLPEYLLISKHRLFSIFGIPESQVGKVNKKQLIYVLCVLGFCLLIALMRVSLRQIIELNGAVIGFFCIYFFPIAIRIKSCYLTSQKLTQPQKEYEEEYEDKEKYVQMMQQKEHKEKNEGRQGKPQQQCADSDDKYYETAKKDKESQDQFNKGTNGAISEPSQRHTTNNETVHITLSTNRKRAELVLFVCMIILGLIIMFYGLVEMFSGNVEQ